MTLDGTLPGTEDIMGILIIFPTGPFYWTTPAVTYADVSLTNTATYKAIT